jgi:hypothetical protein
MDFMVSFVILGDYMKLSSMRTLPSSAAVRATFPLTLWISSSCGLCTNVFHYVIHTSHTPICGRLSKTTKKKRGSLSIVLLNLSQKKFNYINNDGIIYPNPRC